MGTPRSYPWISKRILLAACLLLFLVGALRIFHLLLHTPLLAYANNYDMARLQACQQIWLRNPDGMPTIAGSRSPEPYYRFKELNQGTCFPTSELMFTHLAAQVIYASQALGITGKVFSIKIFGLVRAFFLLGAAAGFLAWFWRLERYWAAFAHALIFAVAISDPVNTLFLNTFYTEFSALFFLYLSLCSLYALLTNNAARPLHAAGGTDVDNAKRLQSLISNLKSPTEKQSLFFGGLFAVSLLLLGLSKPQHMLLPLALWACLVIVQWRVIADFRKIILVLSLAAVLSAVVYQVQFRNDPRNIYVRASNMTNTFLGAILPLATDPIRGTDILGLPPRCAQYVGQTWFTLGQTNEVCPEVVDISYLKLARLVVQDPNILPGLAAVGIQSTRPWLIPHLGQVEAVVYGKVEDYAFSISGWIDRIPAPLFLALFWAPAITFLYALSVIFRKGGDELSNTIILLLCISSSIYIIFFSSLLGDGYADIAKHTHLNMSLYIAWWIIVGITPIRRRVQILPSSRGRWERQPDSQDTPTAALGSR